MKKLFLFSAYMLSSALAIAQIDSLNKSKKINDIAGKNEIKANLLGIAIGSPEITYERILKQKKGIGIATFVSPEKNSEHHFGFTPYFRWYLGKPKILMFFIEGNMVAIYGEGYIYNKGGDSYSVKDVWGIGMGAAIGIKVVQRKSLILEGFLGKGQSLGETRSFSL